MSHNQTDILLALQDGRLRERVLADLSNNGYNLHGMTDEMELAGLVQGNLSPPLIIVDEGWLAARHKNEEDCAALIRSLRALNPQAEIILLNGRDSRLGLAALRAGAFRSLDISFEQGELELAVKSAAQYQQLRSFAWQTVALERLMETSSILLSQLDIAEILEGILHGVQEMGFDRARLYLLSDDRQFLVGKAQVGMQGSQFIGIRWAVADDCHTQELMRERRSRVFQRQPNQPVHSEEYLEKEGVDEWACVPLIFRGEVIGHLSADNKFSQRRVYEQELAPLEIFASQAAIAIDNARLFTKAERRAQKLRAVLELTREINSTTQNFNHVLHIACQKAVELLGVHHSGLILFDENLESGRVYAEYPLQSPRGGRAQLRGVPLEEELIVSRQPIRVDDVANEARLGPVRDLLMKFDIRSSLFVPVISRDKIIGSFGLDSIGQQRFFTDDDVELAQVLAEQIAVAVENSKQFEETQYRANVLESLHQQNLKITSTMRTDRTTLLRLIVGQAVQLLKASDGGIFEYDRKREHLELAAAHYHSDKLPGVYLNDGEVIAWQLIRDGKPHLIVNDLRARPARPGIASDVRLPAAALAVPLRWGNQITGVLYLDDNADRKFTPEDARLLGLFAQTAASALANQKLMDDDGAKLRRLELLSRHITNMLSNLETMPLNERLTLIAQQATEILGAECCGIFQVKRPGYLSLEAGHGYRPGAFILGREFTIRTGRATGLMGHIAYQGELFNARGDALINHFAVIDANSNHTPTGVCRSLLAVPLMKKERQGERLVGLLSVDNKLGLDGRPSSLLGFDQEDEWLIRIFAEAIVISLEAAEWADRLSEHNKQIDSIIKGLPLAATSIDADGNVIQFNTHAERILGFKEVEVLGTKVDPLYFDPREPHRVGKLLHLSPQGKLTNYKTYLRNKNGRAVPAQLTATWLYDERGKRIGSAGYFEDLRLLEAFELIHHASTAVLEAENLSDGLRGMAKIFTEIFPSAFCRILLLCEDGSRLRVEAAVLSPALSIRWRSGVNTLIPLSENPLLKELLENATHADIKQSDPRMQACLEKVRVQLELSQPVNRLLLFPLTIGNRILGLIVLGELAAEEQSQFNPENIQLAASIASQSIVLIDKIRLHEETRAREDLLKALLTSSERMLARKSLPYLLPEIVRLAVQLVGFECGGLCINRGNLGQLEMRAVFNLPDALCGKTLSHQSGLLGLAARTGHIEVQQEYSDWPERESLLESFGLQTMIGIPLKRPSGDVEAILFVADKKAHFATESNRQILERFAAQAMLALQISRSSTHEQRTHQQLETLHQIGNYALAVNEQEKVLHAVLTGITAHYGLRLNRATLLLMDESGKILRGVSGIGQLTFNEAQSAWEEDEARGLNNFASYCERIERGGISWTPLGERIRQFCLPISPEADDCFNVVIREPQHLRLTHSEFDRLPTGFKQLIQPEDQEIVIVPLVVKTQVIGVIAVDNKFSRSPITDEDLNLLAAFANTAAVVLDHARLLSRTNAVNDQLLSLYALSQELFADLDPQHLPEQIVLKLQRAAGAESASLLLIDQATGKIENPIAVPARTQACAAEWIRPDGFSMQVMHTGKEVVMPDTEVLSERINPRVSPSEVPAAICLPLSAPGKRFGVIWLHYNRVRHFTPLEISALKLYVNHAALAIESAQRLERLERLRKATDALAGITDNAEVEKQIVRHARQVLRADAVILWVYNEERDDFISPRSVADGISSSRMKEYRSVRPHHQGTAWKIMNKGSIQVFDLDDLFQSEELGPLTQQIMRDHGARGFRGIALRVREEKLGVLYVLNQQPLGPNEEEHKTALTFANHAALVLRKARLLEQLQRIKQATEQVAHTSLESDRRSTLRAIVKLVKETVDCDAVSLFEYNQYTGQLLHPPMLAGVRDETTVLGEKEKRDYPLVYRMLNEQQPYVVNQVSADAEFRRSRFAIEEGIQSLIVFPLQAEGCRVGVLFVNFRRLHKFKEEELQTLWLFADQAAMALHKQQMYEERAREQEIKKTLGKLSEDLLGVTNVSDVLERAIRHAAALLNTEYCHVVLPRSDGKLCLRAALGWYEDQVGQLCLLPGNGSLTGYTIEQKRPVNVADLAQRQEFAVLDLVLENGMRSALSVPMWRDDKVIGAMLVHSREPQKFRASDSERLQLVANQTAIALRSAERYETLEIQRRHMAAVNEAARAISDSFSSDQKRVLDQIVRQAVEGVSSVAEPKATIATLLRYDEEKDELILESVWPSKREPELQAAIGPARGVKRAQAARERIGVVGRAVLTGEAQLVPNVGIDPDYLAFNPNTRSELAVPLLNGDKVIGALNIESDVVGGLRMEDQEAMQALAKHAVIVRRNARQLLELKETKLIAESRVALALMGLASSTWGHSAVTKAQTIKENILLLRDDLSQGKPLVQIEERLSRIESVAAELQENVPQYPLATEAVTKSEPIYPVIRERLKEVWEREQHTKKGYHYEVIPPENEGIKVKGYALLITRVLDILVSNALKAMTNTSERQLTVGFLPRNGRVEITVRDTGCGIPAPLFELLFREPVSKAEGEEGAGIGLLIAMNVIRAFGGDLFCLKSSPGDTTMVFSLPLEENEA